MDRFGNFLLGLLSGIVGLYFLMHFTLVRAPDGFHLVPKIASKLESPYADIREFKLSNWQKNRSLALSILRADKGHLLNDPRLLTFKESSKKLLAKYSVQANSISVGSTKSVASHTSTVMPVLATPLDYQPVPQSAPSLLSSPNPKGDSPRPIAPATPDNIALGTIGF